MLEFKFGKALNDLRKKNDSAKYNILIVDDLKHMREQLSYLFIDDPSINVYTAKDGLEAVNIVKELDGNLAYISYDVIMPTPKEYEDYLKLIGKFDPNGDNSLDGFKTHEIVREKYPEIVSGFCTAYPGQRKALSDVAKIRGFFRFHVKDDSDAFYEEYKQTIYDAIALKKNMEFEKYIINKISNGQMSKDNLLLLDTIVGGKIVARPFTTKHDIKLVKKFTDPSAVIGAYIDAEDWMVDKAIKESKLASKYFHGLSDDVHHKLMSRFGDVIARSKLGKTNLETIISHSNQASVKVVRRDRMMAAMFAKRTKEYLEWAKRHRKIEDGLENKVRTVGTFIQSSMYQTGPYGIIEALRAKKSLLVKLDSKDPYPQYHVSLAFIKAWMDMQNRGLIDKSAKPPMQVLAWDTRKHLYRGAKVIREMDSIIFMGNPKQAVLIEHNEDLAKFHGRATENYIEVSNALKERKINPKILYYTANKSAGFLGGVKTIGSLEKHIDQIVYSMISHYRSCKRLVNLTVDSDWHQETSLELKKVNFYDIAVDMLKDKLKKLKIGFTGEPDADIVRVSDKYFRGVEKYLSIANRYGEVKKVHPNDKHSPRLIYLDKSKVLQREDGIEKYLSSECMFPVLNIVQGNYNTALHVARMMCSRGDPKNLEYSVWTDDKDVFDKFKAPTPNYVGTGEDMLNTNKYSYGLYMNENTTDGFGTFTRQDWKKRGHQLKILSLELML